MAQEGPRLKQSVVAVGTFDGLHLGHQALLMAMRKTADRMGARVVVVTFDPPPRMVLRPDPSYKLLISLDERLQLLRLYGADEVELLRFDIALSQTSAAAFVEGLIQRHGLVELVGGPDLALGHRRQGTAEVLRELGLAVTVLPPFLLDGAPVRSGQIRELVTAGDVMAAARLLGRPPTLGGVVVHGDHRGRTIGFPTANLSITEDRLWPGNGVYAVRTALADGVMNVGVRPTVDGTRRVAEVHLLDFEGDLYAQQLTVDLIARIRDERRFGSLDELVAQIPLDVEKARRLLN